ncbi:MAG: Endo-1,4-beta-xylanase A [uncultured Sulfurovum sp.]|uniref:Endo-1,4-beta-xylanase A n=1 Tax=uncultured Sulfurovum sp. TaxID=269237 RepID=A0A6S6SR46_9BACT|nr:MAG: Endo-1,4-beta-xylanase A [uncultured Sulfurovum sp.]
MKKTLFLSSLFLTLVSSSLSAESLTSKANYILEATQDMNETTEVVNQPSKIKLFWAKESKRKDPLKNSERDKNRRNSIAGLTQPLNGKNAKKEISEASQYWYKEKKSKFKQTQNTLKVLSPNDLFNQLAVGYGGSSAYDFHAQEGTSTIWMSSIDLALDPNIGNNGYYQRIKDFEAEDFTELQSKLKNSKYIMYWLPKNWSEYWFSISQIQLAMDNGYVPVFMYWYFGDYLINGLPTQTQIDAYVQNNQRVSNFLSQLNGQKIIIMEPEFNKNAILATQATQDEMASILSTGIDNIKNNNANLLVSLCMTDAGSRSEENMATYCGYENCALGDQFSWNQSSRIYEQLLTKLDFISFQEMVAQFSRDPFNPGTWNNPNPKAYSQSDLGINLLAQRINNMTAFLHEKYNKPVFLPYMTIATATWEDSNANNAIEENELDLDGWTEKASNIYENLHDLRGELQNNGLFGYAPMALFDHPGHDKGGYQYFMNNEYHLGISKTNAQDAVQTHLLGDISPKSNIMDFIY